VGEGADAEQVTRALARKGFDLIVTTSFGFMDGTESAAAEFPQARFLHISGFKQNGKNFGSAFGAMEDMKYLAGMIAGARAKADGNPRLGYIAPFPTAEVIRLANALLLGAQTTCRECTMEVRWINSWFDPGGEQQAAESLLNSGVQVVITGADTTFPIAVAGKRGKWAIGYDSSNACDVDRTHCLTTTYWDWGPLYLQVVREIRAGSWRPSAFYGEVDSGILGLWGFGEGQTPAPGVPASVVPLVRQTLAKMRAGQFTRFDVFKGPLTDSAGSVVLPAGRSLDQNDLLGLPGCTACMKWLAQGMIGRIP
jgi:basic membrane protein A